MRTFLRWSARIALGLVVLLAIAAATVYFLTESMLRPDPPEVALAVPPHGDAAEGARLGFVYGCRTCHLEDMRGQELFQEDFLFRIVAPNVSVALQEYSDAELVHLLRTNIRRSGRVALGMPARAFQRLDDETVGHLLAWLRKVPPVETELLPESSLYLPVRGAILGGAYPIEDIRGDPPESPVVLADRNHPDRGRRLLQGVCGECHGVDLAGGEEMGAPALAIIRGYTLEQFTRLMREGTTLAGTDSESGLMSGVARVRFSHLDDDEIAAMWRHASGRAPAVTTEAP